MIVDIECGFGKVVVVFVDNVLDCLVELVNGDVCMLFNYFELLYDMVCEDD